MNPMFYSLLALIAILAATANARGPVSDVDGNTIVSGSYYVVPRFIGPTGGVLTLTPRGDNQCPLYVGVKVEIPAVNKGIPVKFSNWKSKVGFVPESEYLNIEMDVAAKTCGQSTYWWLTRSGPSRTWFVAAGPKPEPEGDSSRSFFQIKTTGGLLPGYTIAYCPTNGRNCLNLGLFLDEFGVQRLAITVVPHEVVFVKATKT